MRTSKKVFLAVAVIFIGCLIYASYDISSRTTFPGSKPQLKERLKEQYLTTDSTNSDSLPTINR